MSVMTPSCLIFKRNMTKQKKIQFCTRQGIGEDAILCLMRLTPEVAQKMEELLKSNPGKYREMLPNGEINYKELDLVKEARKALCLIDSIK